MPLLKQALLGLRPGYVLQENQVGIWAGVAAVFATLATAHHAALVILAIVAMTGDLLAGMSVAWKNGEFCEERLYRGIASKFLRSLLILCGMLVDLVFLVLSQWTGQLESFAAGGVWLTCGTAWLVIAEVGSILKKITAAEGGDVVWPGFTAALETLKGVLRKWLGEPPR